jgi:membrane-bound lytic murein transglycosylase MltF
MTRRLLIAMVALLLSAGSGEAGSPLDHPLDAHLEETYAEDLPGLMKRRYIRVLTTMNRTNFFLAGGKIRGFEYALLKKYEKFLNQKISRRELKVVLEFIPVPRDRLLPALVV